MNKPAIIKQQEVLGKDFKVYGDYENPLFLAKDVAEWIDNKQPTQMVEFIDGDEKLKCLLNTSGQNREMWFLTEDGLYEVLMQSRKSVWEKQEQSTERFMTFQKSL